MKTLKIILIVLLLSVFSHAEYECKEPAPVWEMKNFEYQSDVDAYIIWLGLYIMAYDNYKECMSKYHAPMRLDKGEK
jgi:hypothetical protein